MRIIMSSDLNAALTSLKHTSSRCRQNILYDVLQSLIIKLVIDVLFVWVPAHIGIQGNEVEDLLAKNGLNTNHVEVAISRS